MCCARQELKTLFQETADDLEKETILKSMGNLGSSQLVSILKTIVEDRDMNQKIRLNAIYALRRVAKSFRQQVRLIVHHGDIRSIHSVMSAG